MKNRPLNFPTLTREGLNWELEQRRNVLTGHTPQEDILRYNKLHEDASEYNRRDLVDYYEITLDDFGNYATIGKPAELLQHGLEAVQKALAETNMNYISDDGSDYLNAIADQLQFLASTYRGFDDNETEKELLRVLNDENNDDGDAMAFHYGYADHGSPISDLAARNYEWEG